MKRSISHLKAGDVLRVGYRTFVPTSNDKFIGFKRGQSKVLYDSVREMDEGDRKSPELRAVFHDGQTEWECYRFEGRWCVGSSADPAVLYPPIGS